ncbi:GNAT family N-acetyltransferase [Flammeovirga agarivorans]|uniref:GNAT family N-acetyltransferase n=1 Tax=Flammeovirga agarivorans TaxID=2726742 RepID=A0A7X8SK25_9BACT|nr:GNAT family N-acetyltransferase [Flammeovirga agarivorans]NLR91587.1 GNAT family N-acetyltransferase [Flammeovirga agarivorans]
MQESLQFKYIETTDVFYQAGVDIRIDCFFKNMPEADSLINDAFEHESLHLVCLNSENTVLGTGRLHQVENTAVISQMAIHEDYQRKGIGQAILLQLMAKSKSLDIERIELSARETALDFYAKHGFLTEGNKYPSIKTGIIHQKMYLAL